MASIKPTPVTLSSLKFLKPQDLAKALRTDPSKIAIIDVRDNDHVGGHINNSQWVPAHQVDASMAELLRLNKDKDRVVFHCMLSQVRGPKAALAYARAKAYETAKVEAEAGNQVGDSGADVKDGTSKTGPQEICVLEGGFETWQGYYGADESLTSSYVKDLWE